VLNLRSKGKIILWPIYFDSTVSWSNGRRVPKANAIRAPKTEDIVTAVISAGLKAELQPNVAHPRYPFIKSGYVLVDTKEPKEKVIKLIAGKLSRSN
jgi:signal recognition particle subunit SRP19